MIPSPNDNWCRNFACNMRKLYSYNSAVCKISAYIVITTLVGASKYLSYGWMNGWRCAGSADGKLDNGYVAEGEIYYWHIEADTKCTPVCRRHIFKCILLNKNVSFVIEIALDFVSKVPNKNIPALIKIMAWRRPAFKWANDGYVICHVPILPKAFTLVYTSVSPV